MAHGILYFSGKGISPIKRGSSKTNVGYEGFNQKRKLLILFLQKDDEKMDLMI